MFKNKKKSDKVSRLLEELPKIIKAPVKRSSSQIEKTDIATPSQSIIDEEVIAIIEKDDEGEKQVLENKLQEIQDKTEKSIDFKKSSTWIWYDSPDFALRVDSSSIEQETPTLISESMDINEDSEVKKVELQSFFKKQPEKKKKRYSKKALKKMKNQEQNKVPDDIVNIKVFRYKKKKYKKVEDFISYLDDHYLDIDEIARDVLKNETFFGWLGNQSGIFPKSLEEFKKIKSLIKEKD